MPLRYFPSAFSKSRLLTWSAYVWCRCETGGTTPCGGSATHWRSGSPDAQSRSIFTGTGLGPSEVVHDRQTSDVVEARATQPPYSAVAVHAVMRPQLSERGGGQARGFCHMASAIASPMTRLPAWWNYPTRCHHGHECRPGLVTVGWMPCECPGAQADNVGHLGVRCRAAEGCTASWYRPAHSPGYEPLGMVKMRSSGSRPVGD